MVWIWLKFWIRLKYLVNHYTILIYLKIKISDNQFCSMTEFHNFEFFWIYMFNKSNCLHICNYLIDSSPAIFFQFIHFYRWILLLKIFILLQYFFNCHPTRILNAWWKVINFSHYLKKLCMKLTKRKILFLGIFPFNYETKCKICISCKRLFLKPVNIWIICPIEFALVWKWNFLNDTQTFQKSNWSTNSSPFFKLF